MRHFQPQVNRQPIAAAALMALLPVFGFGPTSHAQPTPMFCPPVAPAPVCVPKTVTHTVEKLVDNPATLRRAERAERALREKQDELDAARAAAQVKITAVQTKLDEATSKLAAAQRAAAVASTAPPTPAPAPSPQPLQVFQEHRFAPRMVLLPQSDRGGAVKGVTLGGSGDDEFPRYTVAVTYKLAMAETELTFDDWAHCVANRGCDAAQPSFGAGTQPLVNVAWRNKPDRPQKDDIQAYLTWLNAAAGLTDPLYQYRLPTEAEWEYAARAGSDGEYSLGRSNQLRLSDKSANYDANHTHTYDGQETPKGQYREKTVAVDDPQFAQAANAWGLKHMHGNVWEWVADCYADKAYTQRQTAGGWDARSLDAASQNGADCRSRVVRGGSWGNFPQSLRSAVRDDYPPGGRFTYVGVRLARTLP